MLISCMSLAHSAYHEETFIQQPAGYPYGAYAYPNVGPYPYPAVAPYPYPNVRYSNPYGGYHPFLGRR